MGTKFTVALFCCFFVLSPALIAGDYTDENVIIRITKQTPDKVFDSAPYIWVNYNQEDSWLKGFLTSKAVFVEWSLDLTHYLTGETVHHKYYSYYPQGISGDVGIYQDSIHKQSNHEVRIYYIRPIEVRYTPVTIKYGPLGVELSAFSLFLIPYPSSEITNSVISLQSSTAPSGVTVTNSGVLVPPESGVNSNFTVTFRGTDDIISPEYVYCVVNFEYDGTLTNPTQDTEKFEVGDKVTMPDGTTGTIFTPSGDIVTDTGAIVGTDSPLSPFYDSSKKTVTGTTTTAKPTEPTETTTTKPEYTGENAETGAIVGALGDVGQGFTESVNNLSGDVTNGLNGLGEGNAEGFNNLVKAISNLNNDANKNSSQERENTEKIAESLEEIAESLVGTEGQEPDDVTISDETTSAPSLTGFLSSVAGFNIAPSSPPVFNISLPRLGGLSPQLLTLDFASIPFLHYFPLVRSILAWTLMIFTFKHIFQIFTLGS